MNDNLQNTSAQALPSNPGSTDPSAISVPGLSENLIPEIQPGQSSLPSPKPEGNIALSGDITREKILLLKALLQELTILNLCWLVQGSSFDKRQPTQISVPVVKVVFPFDVWDENFAQKEVSRD